MLSTLIALSLSLITAAQQPNVPTELRTKALAVAQVVLSYAATSGTSINTAGVTTTQASSTQKTFTTPSGAVIDNTGSVVSIPTSASNNQITVSLGAVTATTKNSIHMEWRTNIPTESKIFYQKGNGPITIVNSKSGNSTFHIVDLTNLEYGVGYPYTIEVIAGDRDQKMIGIMRISCPESGCEVQLY